MKNLTLRIVVLKTILLIVISSKTFSQTTINVSQDEKFEQLLTEKRKLNASVSSNERYKIQIYNGNTETAKNILIEYKKINKFYDGQVVFNTPIYKVWVGNYKTRIEAEKNLVDIKKKYPLAFLVKPNK